MSKYKTNPVDDVIGEYTRATVRYPPFASAHEGYAILLEEVDELWDEVKKKPSKRSLVKMEEEAVQVAATALRFVQDVCRKEAK